MKKELLFLRELKSVAIATVDNGKPSARIADVMLVEDDKFFFLTARGKPYYRQLKQTPRIAVTGMNKEEKSIRVTGNIEFVNRGYLDKIFAVNQGLKFLYPDEKRDILEVFCMSAGTGEIFDLSISPPHRYRFSFGGAEIHPGGYRITDTCNACGQCQPACPVDCISEGPIYQVDASRCLECGRCLEYCAVDAIEPSEPF